MEIHMKFMLMLIDEDFEEYNDMLEDEREIDEEMLRKSGESYD